ncbi:MAG TPA: endonuclease domain-containing protein [Allosphingosinicella sp.]|nr:endonuclease domain-containing protein [Allosphingosinicella sp.]
MAKSSHARTRNAAVLRARQLRRSMSPPEAYLWQVLRRRPDGLKFRRQHPFEHYTADFYCAGAKLVVEIDGASHGMGDNPRRDLRRDASMRGDGLRLVRFNAEDVMRDVESVVTAIVLAARR